VSESAVSAKRGLGLVWRETGAVRNARPSRGQAASTRKRAKWGKRWRSLPFEVARGLDYGWCWEKSRGRGTMGFQ
jgi:hypothetical protein